MKIRKGIRMISAILAVGVTATLLSGCGESKKKEAADTITVYLWSSALYANYVPYVQEQLPSTLNLLWETMTLTFTNL